MTDEAHFVEANFSGLSDIWSLAALKRHAALHSDMEAFPINN